MTESRFIFPEFDSKKGTQLTEHWLLQLNPVTMQDDYGLSAKQLDQKITELNERKVFLEGTAAYLGLDASDTDGMLAEVRRRYAEKGIELTNTIKGWFQKEKTPRTYPKDRRNLYDFCVAMGMAYQETAEFFLKSFLTIPYNYKDCVDAIYFYCLKNNRPYSIIRKMLDEADQFDASNPEGEYTQGIGLHILSINSDEEFMHFLKEHCSDRNHQYATARKELAELIEQNKKIAPLKPRKLRRFSVENQEADVPQAEAPDEELIEDSFKNLGVKRNVDLLYAILGYEYKELTSNEQDNSCFSNLPSFPTEQDISNALSGKETRSSDTVRKLLILMNFYNHYRHMQVSLKKLFIEEDEFNNEAFEFEIETNNILVRCGFVQLYARNPYDWIILFCANSPNPLDCLQGFLSKYYLGNSED